MFIMSSRADFTPLKAFFLEVSISCLERHGAESLRSFESKGDKKMEVLMTWSEGAIVGKPD